MRSLFFGDNSTELKETDFLKYYGGAHRNLHSSTLMPYEEPALRAYLLPHLGRSFYDVLNAYDESGTNDKPRLTEALKLLKRSLVYYMMYDALPDLNVQLTDLGPQQTNDGNGTSNSPSQWSFKAKRWNSMRQADQTLDQLLQFLEEQEGEDFATWRASVERSRQRCSVFSSPREIDQHLNIQGSRRAYDTIIPYFRKAEWRYLEPVLGQEFLKEIATQYAKPEDGKPLHDRAIVLTQRVLAEYGLLMAIPNLTCVIDGEGIVIVSRRDGFDERSGSGLVYNQAAIARLQQSAEGNGATALQDLRAFLRKNADADELTTYKSSDAYPRAEPSNTIISDPDSGAVFL